MFVIGITGPSGAGKTTALRVLERMGGQVYDCDAIYHEMLASDGELLGRIEAAFPGAVKDYTLDRKALGARVFADPEGLQRLTDITQPLVAKRVLEEIARSDASACHSERSAAESKNPYSPSSDPACSADTPPHPSSGFRETPDTTYPARGRLSVIDAIGLFESGLAEFCDLTVAVVADPEIRLRRLMARDGITEDYARSRIAAQKPAEWYASQADVILENNDTADSFAKKCESVFSQMLRAKPTDQSGQTKKENKRKNIKPRRQTHNERKNR